jgi:hypothetical protein
MKILVSEYRAKGDHMLRKTFIPLSAVLLAGFAPFAVSADTDDTTIESEKSDKAPVRNQKAYDRLFKGKIAGEPRDCLPTLGNATPIAVGEDIIAFRRGDIVYRNNLRSICPGLNSKKDILIPVIRSGNVCKNDQVRRVDRFTGIPRSLCVLGEFVPYSKPDKDSDES